MKRSKMTETLSTSKEVPKIKPALQEKYDQEKKEESHAKRLDENNIQEVADQLPEPVGYRILVLPYAGPKKTKGGLWLSDATQETIQMTTVCGLVLKMGDLCYQDNDKFPKGPWCKLQDWVIFSRYAGSRFKIDGGEVRVLNDSFLQYAAALF